MDYEGRFWKDLRSGRFASLVKESSKGQSLSSSQEAYNVLKPLFAEEDDIEKAYFIFLNGQNKILGIENLFTGSITSSYIYPREIVKRLIQLKASAFIMGHPSGTIKPSSEDKSITIKVALSAASIDVKFHDHIIVGTGYYSMADSGWLKSVTRQISKLLESEASLKGGASWI